MLQYFLCGGLPERLARHHLGEIMLQHIQRLIRRRDEETGASAVEYGLLVAAIAALIVLIVFALGGVVKEVFDNTCDTIGTNDQNASTSADC
jgi:pilus assembly protein Flp/PilA